MKNGRLQCKDIPTVPVLLFLAEVAARGTCHGATAGHHDLLPREGYMPTVRDVPQLAALPERLLLAKMEMLIRAKLVDGCSCGCRGDFEITGKGRARIQGQN